jgi:hypothetical protein
MQMHASVRFEFAELKCVSCLGKAMRDIDFHSLSSTEVNRQTDLCTIQTTNPINVNYFQKKTQQYMQNNHQECSRNDWISKTLTFSEVQCVCHSNPIVFEELKTILKDLGILRCFYSLE